MSVGIAKLWLGRGGSGVDVGRVGATGRCGEHPGGERTRWWSGIEAVAGGWIVVVGGSGASGRGQGTGGDRNRHGSE